MPSFTPAYQNAKDLSARLGLSNEFSALMENAVHLSPSDLSVRAKQFLGELSKGLGQLNSQMAWDKLQEFLVTLAKYGNDPAQGEVLARIQAADNAERLRMLNEDAVAKFVATELQRLYGQPRQSRETHTDNIVDETSKQFQDSYAAAASQSNYDQKKRLGMLAYNLIVELVKLFTSPKTHVEAEAEGHEANEAKKKAPAFIPM